METFERSQLELKPSSIVPVWMGENGDFRKRSYLTPQKLINRASLHFNASVMSDSHRATKRKCAQN